MNIIGHTHQIMFLARLGVDWKERDCQVICGRVRSEGLIKIQGVKDGE